jgi:aryl-alcohol dehydrogenase-like predicted oxidoreductase
MVKSAERWGTRKRRQRVRAQRGGPPAGQRLLDRLGPPAKGLGTSYRAEQLTPTQIAQARRMCEIVCVQNFYNVAHRPDDRLIDDLVRNGIAYVPFFPLGGFSPLQSSTFV